MYHLPLGLKAPDPEVIEAMIDLVARDIGVIFDIIWSNKPLLIVISFIAGFIAAMMRCRALRRNRT